MLVTRNFRHRHTVVSNSNISYTLWLKDNDGPLWRVCTAPSEEQSSSVAYRLLAVTDHTGISGHWWDMLQNSERTATCLWVWLPLMQKQKPSCSSWPSMQHMHEPFFNWLNVQWLTNTSQLTKPEETCLVDIWCELVKAEVTVIKPVVVKYHFLVLSYYYQADWTSTTWWTQVVSGTSSDMLGIVCVDLKTIGCVCCVIMVLSTSLDLVLKDWVLYWSKS